MQVKHLEFIDFLRTVAIFTVLLQHCAHSELGGVNLFYRQVSYCNILLFVLVSGYLLVPKQIPIKLMWTKYIKRIAITFAVWSFAYSCYNLIIANDVAIMERMKYFVGDLISGGNVRMWYLVMLIGLYAIIPVVSLVFKRDLILHGQYFTTLLFVVTVLFPTIEMVPSLETCFSLDILRVSSSFPNYMVFYLLLGAILSTNYLEGRRLNLVIGTLFFASVTSIIIFSAFHMKLEQNYVGYFFIVLGFYFYGINCYPKWPIAIKKIVRNIADCSFGIYLIHTFIQYSFRAFSVDRLLTTVMSNYIAIPLYAIVLLLLSWLATFTLRLSKFGRKIT